LALTAMMSLVVSGMLDDVRPRVVAGWVGLGLMICRHHLGREGLAVAPRRVPRGCRRLRVIFAALLSRLMPKEDVR